MKRLFVFLLIVFLLCSTNNFATKNFDVSHMFSGSRVEVYLKDNVRDERYEVIQNGKGCILFAEVGELNYIINTYDINGFTVITKFNNLENVVDLLMPEYYEICGKNVYGYKKMGIKPILLDDVYVNFQLVVVEDLVCIGFPILLGSY